MSRPRAHIVGVGESQYTRWGKIGDVTEHALACQAIQIEHELGSAKHQLDRLGREFAANGLPAA